MSTVNLCNDSLEVEETSEVNEESSLVPTTDDSGLVILGGPYDFCFSIFSTKITVDPSC
jgi:hypothetical protein